MNKLEELFNKMYDEQNNSHKPVVSGKAMDITKEQYLNAKKIVDEYERDEYETNMRIAEHELDEDDPIFGDADQPCSVCGEIDGMVNPCCPDYDPLHRDNCGYG